MMPSMTSYKYKNFYISKAQIGPITILLSYVGQAHLLDIIGKKVDQ